MPPLRGSERDVDDYVFATRDEHKHYSTPRLPKPRYEV